MAEIELSVPARHSPDRRIETRREPEEELTAREEERNERMVEVRRQSTTADALIKLRGLYPSSQ